MGLEGEWVPLPWCLGTDCVWAGPSSQRAATSPAPLILAPGPLGDAMPSSRGGAPSGPWVAALFGAACFASGDRPCAGQLALAHGLSRVRLRHLNRLVLGSGSRVAALSGVARSPSVGRLRAGHLALHMASTVRGCGTSALGLGLVPKSLGTLQARALGSGPRPHWRRNGLPRTLPHKTTNGGRPSPGGPRRCLGRSRLCRPVGLAHGLDRARLRRLSRLYSGPALLASFLPRNGGARTHDSTPPSTPSSSSSSPSSPRPAHTKYNSISTRIVSSSTESTRRLPG
jgi:hypothetical protein